MAQYIDKTALVTEIEKWISGWTERLNNTNPSNPSFFEGGIEVGKHVLSFINTLEVKEVDLDYIKKELDELIRVNKPNGDFGWGTLYNVATHFFELGLKIQKEE